MSPRGGARPRAGRKGRWRNQRTVWVKLPLPADWVASWGDPAGLQELLLDHLWAATAAERPWDRPAQKTAGT